MGKFIILHKKEDNSLVALKFSIVVAISESGDGSIIHHNNCDLTTSPIIVNESISQITKKIEIMGSVNKPFIQPFLWLHKVNNNTRVILQKDNIQLIESVDNGTRITINNSKIKPLYVNESVMSIVAKLNE